ncbi:MAG: hypothetical protein KDA75_13350, partial [Planctomycetaceae bacterium]|nr:hypothetical protein [Planctomycetaceae bacterium]
ARLTGPAKVAASINKKGRVILQIDRRQVAVGKVPGPVSQHPADGLQVGCDLTGTVGNYAAPFAYSGRIGSVAIELDTAKLP